MLVHAKERSSKAKREDGYIFYSQMNLEGVSAVKQLTKVFTYLDVPLLCLYVKSGKGGMTQTANL